VKRLYIFLILILFISCHRLIAFNQQRELQKEIINGVEVISNPIDPVKIEGEFSDFFLEEEFIIDSNDKSLIEKGLTDIGLYFDVDPQGYLYLVCPKAKENCIFKFDSKGNFVTSFGRIGEGPGELVSLSFPPLFIKVNNNEISATNTYKRKLVHFDLEGHFLRDEKFNTNLLVVAPLENNKYLTLGRFDGGRISDGFPLSLSTSSFNKIKELGWRTSPNPDKVNKIEGLYYVLSWSLSHEEIFVGDQEHGYEINVYDYDGNLRRKIRKEFKPIPLTKEYKEDLLDMYKIWPKFIRKMYFPKHFPSYHSFFSDEEGRIFVMTYEKGSKPGEYIYDVFNNEGVFICRKGLKAYFHSDALFAKKKNDRFYFIQENEAGFMKMIVYKVIWVD